MGSLSNRPLVELRVEAEASGDWRSVVACEDTVLHCLHRIVQHAFKPSAQDAAIERAQYCFSLGGRSLGKLRSQALSKAPLGDAFLDGSEALRYVVGGTAYRIAAVKRARGEAKHYVPRCIAGPPGADLRGANRKLLVRRYGRNHTHNKEKKEAPPVRVFHDDTDDKIEEIYMNMMLKLVDFDPVAAALQVLNGQRAA